MKNLKRVVSDDACEVSLAKDPGDFAKRAGNVAAGLNKSVTHVCCSLAADLLGETCVAHNVSRSATHTISGY